VGAGEVPLNKKPEPSHEGTSFAHRDAGTDILAHAAAPLWPVGVGHQPADRGIDRTRRRRHAVRNAGQPDAKVWEILHVANAFEHAAEFDLIHNQADFVPLAFSRLVETPVITTIHGFSSERILPTFRAYEDRVHFVAISEADRRHDLRYAATIHHGIRPEDFPFEPHGGEDLLFFGRIHPDKGAAEAITAARRTGRRLVIAGIVQDQEYHRACVAPAIDNRSVVYLGPVGGATRVKTLGSARALLHLINFSEPFGLSVVEALACGTPVIANDRGSMRELIDHGVTGFLVNSIDDAVAAIGRIGEIDRAACRAAVTACFSVDRMADRYLQLYRSLLA
jgi:glycosyltransferase involved in cell wall biosynthesis